MDGRVAVKIRVHGTLISHASIVAVSGKYHVLLPYLLCSIICSRRDLVIASSMALRSSHMYAVRAIKRSFYLRSDHRRSQDFL